MIPIKFCWLTPRSCDSFHAVSIVAIRMPEMFVKIYITLSKIGRFVPAGLRGTRKSTGRPAGRDTDR